MCKSNKGRPPKDSTNHSFQLWLQKNKYLIASQSRLALYTQQLNSTIRKNNNVKKNNAQNEECKNKIMQLVIGKLKKERKQQIISKFKEYIEKFTFMQSYYQNTQEKVFCSQNDLSYIYYHFLVQDKSLNVSNQLQQLTFLALLTLNNKKNFLHYQTIEYISQNIQYMFNGIKCGVYNAKKQLQNKITQSRQKRYNKQQIINHFSKKFISKEKKQKDEDENSRQFQIFKQSQSQKMDCEPNQKQQEDAYSRGKQGQELAYKQFFLALSNYISSSYYYALKNQWKESNSQVNPNKKDSIETKASSQTKNIKQE